MRAALISLIAILSVLPTAIYGGGTNITHKDCEDHNLSGHFGPPENQEGTELCWAFAATGLLEEHFCLKDPTMCGVRLSALDVASCTWNPTNGDPNLLSQTAKDTGKAVDCALRRGVCLDKDAPFTNLSRLNCPTVLPRAANSLDRKTFKLDEVCYEEEVHSFYDQWKGKISEDAVCRFESGRPFRSDDPSLSTIDDALSSFRSISTSPEQHGLKLLNALVESSTGTDFLRRVLIPPLCEKNRRKETLKILDEFDSNEEDLLSGIRVDTKILIKKSKVEKLTVLDAILRLGRSAEATLAMNQDTLHLVADNKGMGHEVIMDGTRWNLAKGRCEIHIRNSWGDIVPKGVDSLNGWRSADVILRSTEDMHFIRPPGPTSP